MVDIAHRETDALIAATERKIRVIYNEAVQDMQNKLDIYFKEFAEKDKYWQSLLSAGKISEKEYTDWKTGQIMIGKRWEEMKQTLAEDLHNSNAIARSIVNGYMPDAYALNHNYATFLVEKGSQMDTSYTLYDRQTVERLMREDSNLLPPPGKNITDRVAAGKDILWQEGQIQSVTMQSILQGESIGNMAERIARTMGEYDRRDSVRYARTAMTGAQNAGRHDGYERAKRLGIPMKQTWIAVLDNRTRDAHRELDGQTVEVEEPFKVDGHEIRYPGDPDAAGYLIWNCRCTTIAQIKGFERDASNMDLRHDERLGTMSYEEWKNEHRERPTIHGRNTYKSFTQEEYVAWQEANSTQENLEKAFIQKYGMSFAEAEDRYDVDPETGLKYWELADRWRDSTATATQSYGCGYVQNSDGSKAINAYFRRGEIGMYRKSEIMETSTALDLLIDSTTISQNMNVDRWAGVDSLKHLGVDVGNPKTFRIGHAYCSDGYDIQSVATQLKSLIGSEITDNGYMSASVCSDLNVFRGSDVKFTIRVPEGTHAYITDNTRESEIILGRSTRQRIVDVRIISTEAYDYEGKKTERNSIEVVLETFS